jgi:hypothetical protein
MTFAKGQPKPPNSGKRKGSINKSTARARRLTSDDDEIVRRTVGDAKTGNLQAAALYYRFLRPPRPTPKFVPTPIGLKPVTTAKEAAAQIAAVIARLDAGELDLESSHALLEALRAFVAAYTAVELEDEVMKAKLREDEL